MELRREASEAVTGGSMDMKSKSLGVEECLIREKTKIDWTRFSQGTEWMAYIREIL